MRLERESNSLQVVGQLWQLCGWRDTEEECPLEYHLRRSYKCDLALQQSIQQDNNVLQR